MEDSYFRYHSSHELATNEIEAYLLKQIEDIFFCNTRNGQFRPSMKLMNLYKIVSNGLVDDMEFERLFMEIEEKYKVKFDHNIVIDQWTIHDLAAEIHKAGSKARADKI